MNDRELLELAAKAAGYNLKYSYKKHAYFFNHGKVTELEWNPLTDDGDALRLAVKLKIDVLFGVQVGSVQCIYPEEPCESPDIIEPIGEDPYAATRRAIVRAAAEIGKAMP